MKVRPPATYQGGKQRLAEQIVAIVQSEWHRRTYSDFADLCCGSGAVAIAARLDGIPAASIIMIDAEIVRVLAPHVIADGSTTPVREPSTVDTAPSRV